MENSQKATEFPPFHSAVNRIPVLRAEAKDKVKAEKLPAELFLDSGHLPKTWELPGHDHLLPDHWSGSIDLEMTVRTPLVFGEQTKKKEGEAEITYVKLPEADGAAVIPPTMLKGMVSRAYEVFTCSRFRVFGDFNDSSGQGRTHDNHSERLTYRVDPAFANKLKKGKLVRQGGNWAVEIVDTGKKGKKAGSRNNGRGRDYGRARYTAYQNEDAKQDPAILSDDVIEEYKFILRSYLPYMEAVSSAQGNHGGKSRQTATANKGASPGPTNAAARRLKEGKAPLSEGDIVYVEAIEEHMGFRGKRYNIRAMYPAMVSRRAYEKSPRDLAEEQGVIPLSKAAEASAADRLFGYVIPETQRGAAGGDVALKGRISFSSVDTKECVVHRTAKDSGPTPKLPPLLSPKPSSARRFLTESDGSTTAPPRPRHEFFSQGQLLGAPAYPVHQQILGISTLPLENHENSNGPSNDNESVRIRVFSYLKPGSKFTSTLTFANLSGHELATLLWLLTPENLAPPITKKGGDLDAGSQDSRIGYLRMGLGKPLGLGAIEVRIAGSGLQTVNGDDIAKSYKDLSGCLGCSTSNVSIDSFSFYSSSSILQGPPSDLDQKWIRAFQRASFGYEGDAPVRYMTLTENQANNITNNKSGLPQPNRGLSPVDLWRKQPPALAIAPSTEAEGSLAAKNEGKQGSNRGKGRKKKGRDPRK